MKNILKYVLYAFVLTSVMSCNDMIVPEPDVEGGLTITLVSSSHQTKVTMDGVEDLNENKIETIHYFLYPEDPDNPSADNTAAQPSHWGVLENVNAQNEKSFTLNISEDELNNVVFPRPFDECDVYAIVNLPAGVSIGPGTDKSLANLRNIVVNADFVSNETQELFVMEGLGKAKLNSRTAVLAATGEIPVDRVASKLSLNIQVEESVEFDSKTWRSLPDEMTVEFYNGVSRALLSGDPYGVDPMYFGDSRPSRTFAQNGDEWTCSPFYSYPVAWTVGADEEPYLKIVLPWVYESTSVGGQQFVKQNTYYKVILGGESLVRNTWYDLTVNLSILGNFNDFEDNEVEIEDVDYYVVDWSSGLTVNTDIMGARYLVVEKTSYELNNQDVLKIPLSTSHDCEIVDFDTKENLNEASVTRPDYSDEEADPAAPVTWDSNWSLRIVTSETEGSYIEFRHKLNNDITVKPYDYAPYTINFRVRHEDAPENYYRDINIVQNPAMLIEAKANRVVNSYGGVSVNGSTSAYGNYGGVHGLTGTGNRNPNMYVITTTVLPESSKYIIGDPRSMTVNNLSNDNWTEAKGIENLDGDDRQLQYYYPTLTTEDARATIAPKFRVASSYGVTNDISYTQAQYRCASYQEDGYPAGRWRLPTQSEVAFICQLSADKIIPVLFSNGSEYWCAGGTVEPNSDGTVTPSTSITGSTYVRCVYDEWYWEVSDYPRMPDNNVTFTWGDAAR